MEEETKLERRTRELSTLLEIGKAITSTLSTEKILEVVMEKVGSLMESKSWSLLLVDEKTGELTFEIAVSPAGTKLKEVRLKKGQGIAGWVASHGKPLLIPDVSKDPRFASHVDRTVDFSTRSVLCVPVQRKDAVLGAMQLINSVHEGGAFDPDDLNILTTVADFLAIAIENARFTRKIQELVITDDLTGLYNSRHFHNMLEYEIERARRYNLCLSLVFLDLDHFKRINDTHGHLTGSRVLTEIGRVIRDNIRKVDLGVRYGGDEFVIILPSTDKKGAFTVATHLRSQLRNHVLRAEEGEEFRVTGSFGVASFPEDADTKEDLIARADQLMYQVKESSRDGVLTL